MPRYTYIAKSGPHKTVQGSIEAETEQEVINRLAKIGCFPLSIEFEDILLREGLLRLRKVSKKDIALFTRQLSSLIESGVNVINGINIIANQTSNKYLRVILNDVSGKIKGGKSLSQSIDAYPYLFSNLYSAIIGVGEASGNLNEALKRLSDFLEKDEEFKDSLRSSLTYPFFIFVISILTIFVLLMFVIPRLITMFEDMGQILPLPTRILIYTSDFLHSYGVVIAAFVIASIFILRRMLRIPQGRGAFDKIKLKLLIFGRIILKTEVSRLTRTLSLLLSSGISIMQALDISISIVENQIVKHEVLKFKEKIGSGLSLSQAFRGSGIFPEFVTSILAIGEETGSLERSLIRIADDYEKEVNRTVKELTRLLEPIIILVMGLIVGFIVLSMLLPIFQINLIVK